MGGGSFVPKQQNWHWMKDDGAQPTDQWANENTTFTMSDNGDILRMRVTINETGGKGANNIDLKFEYSTDDSAFNTPGADQAWNYANGQATEGNILTTNHCTDTTGKGEYVESAGGSGAFDISASTSYEFDFAVTPGTGVSGNTLYYFRILIDDAEVVLNSGEAHPNCTTTIQSTPVTVTPNQQDITVSQQTATTTAQKQATTTPNVQTATVTQQTATVSTATEVTVTPDAIASTVSQQTATVSTQLQPTITPSVQATTVSTQTATISAQKQPTVTPDAIVSTYSQPTLTVDVGGEAVVTPEVQTATASQQAIAVTTQLQPTVTPAVITGTYSIPAPILSTQLQPTVTPSANLFTYTNPALTILASRNLIIHVSGNPVNIILSQPAIIASGEGESSIGGSYRMEMGMGMN